MTEQKINKSDFTDRKGVVHDSIGENIRSDNNQLSADYINSMSEDERLMFPFFPFKKGKWEKVVDTITDSVHTADKYFISSTNNEMIVDYRVKYVILLASEVTASFSGVIYVVPQKGRSPFTYIRFNSALSDTENGKNIEFLFYVEDE